MEIETTRFGRLEVSDELILRFPRGLYGMEHLRRFCMLRHDENGLFFWLQSVDDPAIAMVLTDPFRFFTGYEVEIPDPAVGLLEASDAGDVVIYTTVSFTREPTGTFTNLLGPVVVNHDSRVGVQVILDDKMYTTRHPLTEARMGALAVAA